MKSLLSSRLSLSLLVLAAGLGLGGCAHHHRSGGYGDYDRGGYGYDQRGGSHVQYGYVRSIEALQARNDDRYRGERSEREADRTTGGGALAGAIIGGVIGNQVGGGSGKAAATAIGIMGGAVLGNEAERQNNRERDAYYERDGRGYPGQRVFRVVVRLDNRSEQMFDFERLDGLKVGDRVRLDNGRLQRY